MMTEEQREWLRTRLLELREEVVKDLERQRSADRSAGAKDQVDAVDRAEIELERAFEHRREHDDTHLLQKIHHALARLDGGLHDVCERCQAAITWERLSARPYASLCHACQQAKEDGQTVEEQR